MRQASRTVGVQIALASTVLVVLIVTSTFVFVFANVSPANLVRWGDEDMTIDIRGIDILFAAIVIGAAAITFGGLLSSFATRRAIRPLGEALRLQRTFVANASHELRTPLAVLDARLQSLQRSRGPGDPSAGALSELRGDAARLAEIVNSLLAVAEERQDDLGTPASVDARAIIESAVGSLRMLAQDQHVTIELTAEPVSVLMPEVAVHRCAIALLDNALRFAPDGSTIVVTLSVDSGFAELRVTDRGAGVTGLRPDEVFDRFARGSGGRASATGVGLGLALVKDTVGRYRGTVSIENTGAGGTTMLLRIPRARRA